MLWYGDRYTMTIDTFVNIIDTVNRVAIIITCIRSDYLTNDQYHWYRNHDCYIDKYTMIIDTIVNIIDTVIKI